MNVIQKLYKHFTYNLTARKALAVVLGNLILGFGCALLAYSLMGNEPYTAMNMAMSGGFHMGLGNYQLIVNFIIIVLSVFGGLITWQTSHLGIGTIVGAFCLGPFINFFNKYNRVWIEKK